jgi:hypothetical protein
MVQRQLPPNWKKLVANAQRALILNEPLAKMVTGMTHAKAREIINLENKRLELERHTRIEKAIVRKNL